MRPRRFLIGLLVAATICLDLLVMTTVRQPFAGETSSLSTIFLLISSGFALGQTVLAGVWLVWGKASVVTRLFTAAAFVMVAASVSNGVNYGFAFRLFLVWHIVFWAVVLSALITVRGFGLRLLPADGDADNNSSGMPWQYTLAQLLSWTTAVAVVLGVALRFWHPQITPAQVFAVVLPYAVVAIVAVFGAFQRQTPLSMLLLFFATPLIAAVPVWLEGTWSLAAWKDRFVVSAGLTAYVAASIAVLRAGGLRLQSKAKESTKPALDLAVGPLVEP